MTTADLIREHLGERWWEREHDGTAICVMLDRIMEEFDVGPVEAYSNVVWATLHARSLFEPEPPSKFYKAVRLAIPEGERVESDHNSN